jgi:hypothetical protein
MDQWTRDTPASNDWHGLVCCGAFLKSLILLSGEGRGHVHRLTESSQEAKLSQGYPQK